MDVNVFAEDLLQRLDQPRMTGQQAEGLVERVRGESGARRTGFLAPYFLAIEFEDRLGIIAQQRDLLLAEAIRKKQIALFVEGFDLSGVELHDAFPDAFLTRFVMRFRKSRYRFTQI